MPETITKTYVCDSCGVERPGSSVWIKGKIRYTTEIAWDTILEQKKGVFCSKQCVVSWAVPLLKLEHCSTNVLITYALP